jgi:hypothetical protein
MNLTASDYPVLSLGKTGVMKYETPERQTTGTALGLKKGYFHGYRIVDANGRRFFVKSARMLHGVGLFGGWGIFGDRIIRVEQELELETPSVDLAALKADVERSFKKDYKAYGDDYVAGLIAAVRAAKTVREVIDAVPGLPKTAK